MPNTWTFGRKIAGGFPLTVVLMLVVSAVSVRALRTVMENKDLLLTVTVENLINAAKLEASANYVSANFRAFLLTGEEHYLDKMRDARAEFGSTLGALRSHVSTAEAGDLDEVARLEVDYNDGLEKLVTARKAGAAIATIVGPFESEQRPKREAMKTAIAGFVQQERRRLEDGKQASTRVASSAIGLLIAISIITILISASVALL